MNFFYVFTTCLAASAPTVALRTADASHVDLVFYDNPLSVVVQPTGGSGYNSLLTESDAVVPASALMEVSERAEAGAPATGGAASWYMAKYRVGLRHLAHHDGNAGGVALVLFILVTIAVCIVVLLGNFYLSSKRETAAQDLLLQPEVPAPLPQQDTRVPQPPQPARPAPKEPKKEKGGFLGMLGGIGDMLGLRSEEAPIVRNPSVPFRRVMMPEMIVQESEGAQFFIDGVLGPQEQKGYLEVWRISGDHDLRMVMKLLFCEGDANERHQNGITVELPNLCNTPVAFINTQHASLSAGHDRHHTAVSQKRHTTIFDTFTGALDFRNPFCIVENEKRGATLRSLNGQVICCVSSGGYNTDFGNIVDGDGRLIATMSNRGHSLSGLGLVRGAWKENRKVLQIAQGQDVLLLVCAIVSAAKLS